MKLLRVGPPGQEKPAFLHRDGSRRDAAGFFSQQPGCGHDYDERFFAGDGLTALKDWIATQGDGAPVFSDNERLGPPVGRPSKLVCIGLNYRDHAAESGMALPTEPVVFFKATTAICGPNDTIELPPGSEKTDWEVELAVVIGRTARRIAEADAMSHVAGYCVHNDLSERAYQLERGGQWVKGKSCDTFAPLGPWLVTADEVPDPQQLPLWLTVNGTDRQRSTTAQMIFPVSQVISYLSHFMTLLPGDIVSTGTPHGVGLGMKPPVYLRSGDVVELGIEGLGTQCSPVR